MSLFMRAFPKWLPIGVAVSMVLLISYTFAQQVYRMSANDPQVMMAHDIAASVASGTPADQLVSRETVDPSVSLAPFVIVLDSSRHVVVSSMTLGGGSPVPPSGVLDTAKASGEYRVTWQPRRDARIASVVVPVKGGPGGFVVAGRSLKAVEDRVDQLGQIAGLGWIGTLVFTLLATVMGVWLTERAAGADDDEA
jgi:hypothetical protein